MHFKPVLVLATRLIQRGHPGWSCTTMNKQRGGSHSSNQPVSWCFTMSLKPQEGKEANSKYLKATYHLILHTETCTLSPHTQLTPSPTFLHTRRRMKEILLFDVLLFSAAQTVREGLIIKGSAWLGKGPRDQMRDCDHGRHGLSWHTALIQ